MDKELKMIKKLYGEEFMHFCRSKFATILETPNLLLNTLRKTVYPTKTLYLDIAELLPNFEKYIYSLVTDEKEKSTDVNNKTPYELMDEAGYTLYKCNNEKEIQFFKRYYAKGEELCTFHGGRLNTNYVYFAVKKDIDNIKRFDKPSRQDDYGTSVISIQVSKVSHMVSIKNRYNHTVFNPDATFGNNLDNIILGLTDSFSRELGVIINEKSNNSFEIPGYVKCNDGVMYKYNYETDNTYFCPDNIVIVDFEPIHYDPAASILIESLLIDFSNHKIINLMPNNSVGALDRMHFNKCIVTKKDNNKILNIDDSVIIEINKDNRIIKYIDFITEETGMHFLGGSSEIEYLCMPNLKKTGLYFLMGNTNKLKVVELDNLETIGSYFLSRNESLMKFNLPNVKVIGDYALSNNNSIKDIYLPKVEYIGKDFLKYNKVIEKVDLPSLENIPPDFLYSAKNLKVLFLSGLREYSSYILMYAKKVSSMALPHKLLVSKPVNKKELKILISEKKNKQLKLIHT